MTDLPISALPVADPIYGNEIVPCVQAGETVQTTPAEMQLGGGSPSPLSLLARFGDGSDGDVTISAGTVTLARDMYYDNLTIDGTGSLATAGYKVFVKSILDLSAAPIRAIGRSAHDGGAAAGSVAGSAGILLDSQTVGGNAAASSASATGGVGVGAQGGGAPAVVNPGNGGRGGGTTATAGGGAGSAGAGGAGRTANTPTNALPFWRVFPELLRGVTRLLGGNSSPGAGSGAGDGVNSGGGGGGSGSGGGVVYVAAHTILRGAGTAAGAIRAKGGDGGVGGTAPAGNCGGGGGGNGGGGGWIYLLYMYLTGTPATYLLDAGGGNGAAGGNGAGTGIGGQGGQGGYGGRITVINTLTGQIWTNNQTANASTATVQAPTGATGGIGGLGTPTQLTL